MKKWSDDDRRSCGCVFGFRRVCVSHCGGHAIPKPTRLGDVDAVRAEMTGILHVLAGDTGPASSDWTPEASLMRLAALIGRIEAVAPEAE